jgi:lysophospholipase L1-like esterase
MSQTTVLREDPPAPTTLRQEGRGRLLTRLRPWLGALLVALAAGELASRLDDWLFSDTPLLATPDRASDLLKPEPWGVRGRPDGRYRRWQLDGNGFASPQVGLEAKGRRVMVLGASETFGLYESKGKDYPAQLALELQKRGIRDIEVVNAAIAGLTLPWLETYWVNWASRFKPDVVLIYPSAHFYLDTEIPKPPVWHDPPQELPRTDLPSRLGMRFLDKARQFPPLRSARRHWIVSGALAGKGPDYLFTSPPKDRVAAFVQALERLTEAVERTGSRPVLVTQAFMTPLELSATDRAQLEYFRIFFPRALPEVFPAFSAEARNAVNALGKRRGWAVIDVASELSGKRELFADPVHFTDTGSQRVAKLLADAVPAVLPPVGNRKETR